MNDAIRSLFKLGAEWLYPLPNRGIIAWRNEINAERCAQIAAMTLASRFGYDLKPTYHILNPQGQRRYVAALYMKAVTTHSALICFDDDFNVVGLIAVSDKGAKTFVPLDEPVTRFIAKDGDGNHSYAVYPDGSAICWKWGIWPRPRFQQVFFVTRWARNKIQMSWRFPGVYKVHVRTYPAKGYFPVSFEWADVPSSDPLPIDDKGMITVPAPGYPAHIGGRISSRIG